MGFSKEMATPVLDYPGNRNIEAAVNGVVEHETDPDIDAMLSVPAISKVEDPKPSLTPEEIKIKAEELMERARKIMEREVKLMEREKEMRIRVGKEQAKRIVEGSDRRSIWELQDSDNELERKTLERLRQRWDSFQDNHKVKTAFNTLLTYAKNVANNPDEEKFRKIRLCNAAFQRLLRMDGVKFLFLFRDEVDMEVLNSAVCELNNAINDPVIGVL